MFWVKVFVEHYLNYNVLFTAFVLCLQIIDKFISSVLVGHFHFSALLIHCIIFYTDTLTIYIIYVLHKKILQ